MSRHDTVTGKFGAEFYFFDQYEIFARLPNNEDIDVQTRPVFTSEVDAQAAEDLAFDVFLATVRAMRGVDDVPLHAIAVDHNGKNAKRA